MIRLSMVKVHLQMHLWILKSISGISLLPLCRGWFMMVAAHSKTFIGLCHLEKREFSVNLKYAIAFLLSGDAGYAKNEALRRIFPEPVRASKPSSAP